MGRGLLIIVSGLFVAYGTIQRSLQKRQKSITQQSTKYVTEVQSKIIANAMVDLAFAEINKYPESAYAGNFDEISMLGGTGKVDMTYELPFAPSNPFVKYKIIKASGTYDGTTTKVTAKVKRRAFSEYSYFTVEEQSNIYFADGNVLNGPVHTNGTFHIDGSPVFNGKVTSPNQWVGKDGRNNETPEFNEGVDFDYDYIDLPIEVPELAQEASDGGLRFNGPIKIYFYNDNFSGYDVGKALIAKATATGRYFDQYCYCYKTYYQWGTAQSYNLDAYNGIISSSGDIQVEGTLNGDYTIHSEGDIEIMGDLRYFDDPLNEDKDAASDDFLGMVSEGNTIVDRNAHKANDATNIDIQASIMALDETSSFHVEDYNDGIERGTINLLGGLIQYERGAVGLISGSGYNKNYSYDERFLGRPPRGFPPSDVYEYLSWKTTYE